MLLSMYLHYNVSFFFSFFFFFFLKIPRSFLFCFHVATSVCPNGGEGTRNDRNQGQKVQEVKWLGEMLLMKKNISSVWRAQRWEIVGKGTYMGCIRPLRSMGFVNWLNKYNERNITIQLLFHSSFFFFVFDLNWIFIHEFEFSFVRCD